MRAQFIIIGRIRGQGPPQMPRAEDKNVIQTVAPKRSNHAFSIWILPRRSRWRWSVTYAHRPNPPPEGLPVNTIIVAHQIGRRRVPRNASTICWASHSAVGRRVTANHSSCRRPWPTTRNANRHSKVRVGTTQRSIAAIASAWLLRRNGLQLWDGGPRRRIMYLDTVDSASPNPSFRSSPWMRGAPHNGFSVFTRR